MRSPLEDGFDRRLRAAAMDRLEHKTNQGVSAVTRAELSDFRLDGMRVPLVDPQQGIRKPQGTSAALSILGNTSLSWTSRQMRPGGRAPRMLYRKALRSEPMQSG